MPMKLSSVFREPRETFLPIPLVFSANEEKQLPSATPANSQPIRTRDEVADASALAKALEDLGQLLNAHFESEDRPAFLQANSSNFLLLVEHVFNRDNQLSSAHVNHFGTEAMSALCQSLIIKLDAVSVSLISGDLSLVNVKSKESGELFQEEPILELKAAVDCARVAAQLVLRWPSCTFLLPRIELISSLVCRCIMKTFAHISIQVSLTSRLTKLATLWLHEGSLLQLTQSLTTDSKLTTPTKGHPTPKWLIPVIVALQWLPHEFSTLLERSVAEVVDRVSFSSWNSFAGCRQWL